MPTTSAAFFLAKLWNLLRHGIFQSSAIPDAISIKIKMERPTKTSVTRVGSRMEMVERELKDLTRFLNDFVREKLPDGTTVRELVRSS